MINKWGDSMAINVTTWTQLVNELKRLHADDEDVVINLMNDIDMNDGYASGVSTTQIKCFGRSMILNGNGHCIRNLRTSISNPQPIFSMADYHYSANVPLRISNLDFVNLICAGADFLQDSASYRYVQLTNCRFVGYRTGNSYLIGQDAYINCISCYFDMPWYGAGSSVYDYTSLVKRGTPTGDAIPVANYCWFHESYGGWTITNSESSGYVRPPQEYPVTQCSMFAMNGCYIDGTMKNGVYYWGSSGNGIFYSCVYRKEIGENYTASTPNVIDMHWYSGLNYRYITVKVLNMNGVFNKSFNAGTYEAYEYQRVTTGSQPNIILATPEQMENVEWLRSQGFPIIDPTPVED